MQGQVLRNPFFAWLHWTIGRGAVVFGWVNIFFGFGEFRANFPLGNWPQIAFGLYLGSVVLVRLHAWHPLISMPSRRITRLKYPSHPVPPPSGREAGRRLTTSNSSTICPHLPVVGHGRCCWNMQWHALVDMFGALCSESTEMLTHPFCVNCFGNECKNAAADTPSVSICTQFNAPQIFLYDKGSGTVKHVVVCPNSCQRLLATNINPAFA